MRLEKVNECKIKIFLSQEDLDEKGILENELWQDMPEVHQLFHELLQDAENELNFFADCPVVVEVFSLPQDGIVIEVTKSNVEFDEVESDVTINKEIPKKLFYVFESFDAVIFACDLLIKAGVNTGKLYTKDNQYFIYINAKFNQCKETIQAILAEFGNEAEESVYQVCEYGKLLLEDPCARKIVSIFLK